VTISISPSQSNVQQALLAFLSQVLPGLPGQAPAVFVGSIAGNVLTVAALPGKVPVGIQGTVQLNAPLLGLGVAPGTTIAAQLTGPAGGAGTYQVSIAQTVAQATMSTGVSAVPGQANRVPEPVNPFFAVATPIRIDRLATNVDGSADVKLVGSIAGNTLTVSQVIAGQLEVGAALFGTGVAANTVVTGVSVTAGGPGAYAVSPAQIAAPQTMSAGAKTLTQSAEVTIQVDFHSSDSTAGDFAQTVSTCLRDSFGVDFFAALAPPLNGVVPLYADDPRQVGFQNAEQQWEFRWSLDVCLQIYQTVSVNQQYADSAQIELIDVDAEFPP
jgi:hypothetical protein